MQQRSAMLSVELGWWAAGYREKGEVLPCQRVVTRESRRTRSFPWTFREQFCGDLTGTVRFKLALTKATEGPTVVRLITKHLYHKGKGGKTASGYIFTWGYSLGVSGDAPNTGKGCLGKQVSRGWPWTLSQVAYMNSQEGRQLWENCSRLLGLSLDCQPPNNNVETSY